MSDIEEWRSITGWEGLYEISSLGRVRSLDRRLGKQRLGGKVYAPLTKGRVVKPRSSGTVDLYRRGEVERLRISALLASAFNIGNPAIEDQDLPNEEWRPVPDWDGLYEVSNLGRVRATETVTLIRLTNRRQHYRRRPAKILKHYFDARPSTLPYPFVVLQKHDRKSTEMVHRLVCKAFHGPAPAGKQVCHINGEPGDARAANLRWGTQKENERDKVIYGFARLASISVEETLTLIRALSTGASTNDSDQYNRSDCICGALAGRRSGCPEVLVAGG